MPPDAPDMPPLCRWCHHEGAHQYLNGRLCSQHLMVALERSGWLGHLEDPPAFPPEVTLGDVVSRPEKPRVGFSATPWWWP